jgi:hypothetical protein
VGRVLWGLNKDRGFTQYSRRLSPLIPTKPLVPNKAWVGEERHGGRRGIRGFGGSGPRARSPPRRQRRRGVLLASQTGEGDSTARSPSSRRRTGSACSRLSRVQFNIVGRRCKSGPSYFSILMHVSSVGLSVLICNFLCCFCHSVTVIDLNGSGFSKVIPTYGCGFFRSTKGPENPFSLHLVFCSKNLNVCLCITESRWTQVISEILNVCLFRLQVVSSQVAVLRILYSRPLYPLSFCTSIELRFRPFFGFLLVVSLCFKLLFLITQLADLLILIIFISQFVGAVVILFAFFPLDIIVMECSSFLSFILVD